MTFVFFVTFVVSCGMHVRDTAILLTETAATSQVTTKNAKHTKSTKKNCLY